MATQLSPDQINSGQVVPVDPGSLASLGTSFPPNTVLKFKSGNNYILYQTDASGNPTLAGDTPIPQTDLQAASTAKAYSQAAKADVITGYGGQKMIVVTDDKGVPIKDPNNPTMPLMQPLGSPEQNTAFLDHIKAQTGHELALTDQAKAATSEAQAQAGLIGVNTDLARQKLTGDLGTALQQIRDNSALSLEQKDSLMKNVVDHYNNLYADTVNKAAAVNEYNRTQADQATKMATEGRAYASNVMNMGEQAAAHGAFAAGPAMADLLKAGPGILGSFGGSPAKLQNPMDLWQSVAKPGSFMDYLKGLSNGGDSSTPVNSGDTYGSTRPRAYTPPATPPATPSATPLPNSGDTYNSLLNPGTSSTALPVNSGDTYNSLNPGIGMGNDLGVPGSTIGGNWDSNTPPNPADVSASYVANAPAGWNPQSGILGSGIYNAITPGILQGYAAGGNPPVGKPALVGEKGPEVIVPQTPVTVVPNSVLQSMKGAATPTVMPHHGLPPGTLQKVQGLIKAGVHPRNAVLSAYQQAGGDPNHLLNLHPAGAR